MTSPKRRELRRLAAPIALLSIALLGGCGGATDGTAAEPEASPSPGRVAGTPSASPEQSKTPAPPTPAPTTAPAEEPAARFLPTMVRALEVNKEAKGGQANVHVVADVMDFRALLDVGHGCVKHYLGEQKAAFCHVWGTQADYDARDPRGAGDLLCWVHYVGVPLVGGDPLVMSSASYTLAIEGCPNAAEYTF